MEPSTRHHGDYKRPEDIDHVVALVAALVEVREGKILRNNRDVE